MVADEYAWLDQLIQDLKRRRPPPTVSECSEALVKYAPKDFRQWAPLLRRIADKIDAHPPTVELSAKSIGALIELSMQKDKT